MKYVYHDCTKKGANPGANQGTSYILKLTKDLTYLYWTDCSSKSKFEMVQSSLYADKSSKTPQRDIEQFLENFKEDWEGLTLRKENFKKHWGLFHGLFNPTNFFLPKNLPCEVFSTQNFQICHVYM